MNIIARKWEEIFRERYGHIEYKSPNPKNKRQRQHRNAGCRTKGVWIRYWRECIPIGYEIHHFDGNRKNRRISNLALVTTDFHKIVHHKRRIRNGVLKTCREELE